MIGFIQPSLPELPPGPSLENIRGPVEIPILEPWQILLIAVLTFIFLAISIFFIIKYIRKAFRPSLPDPETKAFQELDVIKKETDNGTFATRTSEILRGYIEETRDLPALRQSRTELISMAQLPGPQHAQLDTFLDTCDRVKFAREPLTKAMRIELLKTARQLIQDLSQTKTETKK